MSANSGQWNIRNQKFSYVPHEISQWAVVCFGRVDQTVERFIETLVKCAKSSGIHCKSQLDIKDSNSARSVRQSSKEIQTKT